MNDNPAVRRRILREMHYITRNQLGISDFEFPLVVFNEKDIPADMKESFDNDWYGGCSPELPLIFLNLTEIPDEKKLQDTILHELVHYRFCCHNHSAKFDRRLYAMQRGDIFPKAKMCFRMSRDKHIQYYFQTDVRSGVGRGNGPRRHQRNVKI